MRLCGILILTVSFQSNNHRNIKVSKPTHSTRVMCTKPSNVTRCQRIITHTPPPPIQTYLIPVPSPPHTHRVRSSGASNFKILWIPPIVLMTAPTHGQPGTARVTATCPNRLKTAPGSFHEFGPKTEWTDLGSAKQSLLRRC